MDARLILEPPAGGSWNMAVDQALLESVDAGGPPAIRIYRWSAPTLSLGYFQSRAERSAHLASREIACVRRATGGGAIVHDRELTYSVAMPVANRSARHVSELYCRVHQAMIAWLAREGVTAQRFAELRAARPTAEPGTAPPTSPSPFLCFQRRTDDDLVLSGCKVAGSAQRRGRRSVLQHGSLLLSASPAAPELPGVSELAGRTVPGDLAAAEAMGHLIAQHLGLPYQLQTLDESLQHRALQIQTSRFANDRWLNRR